MHALRLLAPFCVVVFLAVANADDEKKASLKDDFSALKNGEGIWTANVPGKRDLKMRVKFESKDFPKIRVTVSKLELEGKGFTPTELYSGDTSIQEKDDKRVLTIEGSDIAYSLKEKGFLAIMGTFESKKMKIDLTGKYGETFTGKGKK